MRGVDTWPDQTMADIIASPHGRFYIAAIAWVDIDCIGQTLCFADEGKLCDHVIIVGTAGILGTDGYHMLIAAKITADASHINGNHIFGINWHTGSAKADFFINRKQQSDFAGQGDFLLFDPSGNAKQNRSGKLIIQEA